MWNIINSIYYDKKDWNSFTQEEQQSFIPFIAHKGISMKEEYCEIANIVQEKINLTPEQVYNFYCKILPKQKVFSKWVKSTLPTYPSELLEILSNYWGISKRESKDYLKNQLISKNELIQLLESLGKTDSEIKILLK